ncbi:hypothetical protein [Gaiella sp.]
MSRVHRGERRRPDHRDVWSVNTEEVYLEEGEAVDALFDLELAG